MLEDASIKLSAVASSLNTVSARAMLAAMIDGETDPLELAELAKGRNASQDPRPGGGADRHTSTTTTPGWRGRCCCGSDLVEAALAELDEVIAEACAPWQHQIDLLQTIPGVGVKIAQVIIAETGGDMSRFPSAAHLAAWAGLAPAMQRVGWEADTGRGSGAATSG